MKFLVTTVRRKPPKGGPSLGDRWYESINSAIRSVYSDAEVVTASDYFQTSQVSPVLANSWAGIDRLLIDLSLDDAKLWMLLGSALSSNVQTLITQAVDVAGPSLGE